ncbi:MAG: hypothetical protein ACR2N2_01510 [Acidimicrobiia bacterium]
MKRHAFDPLSFVFGVIFIAMAVAATVNDQINWDLGPWLLPAAALMLGIGLLASALRFTMTKDDG